MGEIITLVTNHGLSLAIAILVLYGGVRLMNIYLEKLKVNLNKKQPDNLVENRLKIDEEINHLLERVLLKTGADRISILEFHNGDKNLSGMPFIKLTNTYEVCDKDTPSQQSDYINLPCSLFSKFIDKVLKNKYVLIDVNNDNSNFLSITMALLKKWNVKKAIYAKIIDNHDRYIGFVGIQYCDNSIENLDSILSTLNESAIELGVMLCFNKSIK